MYQSVLKSVMISFFASEKEDRQKTLVNVECLFHASTAVNINHYVRHIKLV